jgi:hypothetical protein
VIEVLLIVLVVIALASLALGGASVRVLREYERGVVFRPCWCRAPIAWSA